MTKEDLFPGGDVIMIIAERGARTDGRRIELEDLAGEELSVGMMAFKEAIDSYNKVISLNPAFESAHFKLGLIYTQLGRLKDGKNAFEKVIRLNPDAAPAYFILQLPIPNWVTTMLRSRPIKRCFASGPNMRQPTTIWACFMVNWVNR